MRTAVSVQRAVRNQALFRAVNEEIRDASEVASCGGDTIHDFVCECASETCTTPIKLSLREYDELRTNLRRFAVAPGHEDPGLEQIVREGPSATMVEMRGEAGRLAETTHPRAVREAS